MILLKKFKVLLIEERAFKVDWALSYDEESRAKGQYVAAWINNENVNLLRGKVRNENSRLQRVMGNRQFRFDQNRQRRMKGLRQRSYFYSDKEGYLIEEKLPFDSTPLVFISTPTGQSSVFDLLRTNGS